MRKLAILAAGFAVVVAILMASGFRLQRGGSGWPAFVARTNDDALEADRAQQREVNAASSPAAAFPAAAAASAAQAGAPNAPDAPVAPIAPTAPIAPAAPVSPVGSAWSDFRGPDRDGRYTAAPIRTTWPAEGLPRLWRQPVGGG